MEFFTDSNIQFMKYRKYWMILSIALLLVGAIEVLFVGKLNLGIDFAGGTQLTLKFSEPIEIERLRDIVAGAGVEDAVIQSFGAAGVNEALIKTPVVEGSQEGSQALVVSALDAALDNLGPGIDLNRVGRETVEALLSSSDPDAVMAGKERYGPAVDAILGFRRERGLIEDWGSISALPQVTPAILEALEAGARLGKFSILGAENVGPQIGSELRQKGLLAIVSSMIGMLIYIWIRFELRFGVGALVAVLHDVFITVGLYALLGFEFNLTTIAAFLTLVGYSVNDTVVVFDRVRENLRRARSTPLEETMNVSLNQTLSRTVLTSGTTLLVVGSILFLGGDVLRGFAFILTVGVIVGTYSSIYVACPFALLWESMFGRGARGRRREARATSA
ncbi:MAG: protein translocase subunit SecF [Acidobacteria bacterium]|nr:protein translocase subunit SecF [Acidobacteriota bacterium]